MSVIFGILFVSAAGIAASFLVVALREGALVLRNREGKLRPHLRSRAEKHRYRSGVAAGRRIRSVRSVEM